MQVDAEFSLFPSVAFLHCGREHLHIVFLTRLTVDCAVGEKLHEHGDELIEETCRIDRTQDVHVCLRQLGVASLHETARRVQMPFNPTPHGRGAFVERSRLATACQKTAAREVTEACHLQHKQKQLANAPIGSEVSNAQFIGRLGLVGSATVATIVSAVSASTLSTAADATAAPKGGRDERVCRRCHKTCAARSKRN